MRGHLTIQLLWTTDGLLVTRFIVLSTQWMKEMRTWGWSEITYSCFFHMATIMNFYDYNFIKNK